MPCNSDYMNASWHEKMASRVLLLLDEIKTGIPVDPKSSSWGGYHPAVYKKGMSQARLNALTDELCRKLADSKRPMTSYSLEMQMWWREHQRADEQRIKEQKENLEQHNLRQSALAKLTEQERKALGLEKLTK